MIKSKRSIYNALAALSLSLFNGFLSFIVTKLVLNAYGSDFNGMNATATQLVNMLSILEGGFTVATNVSMFKPIAENDTYAINRIMVATRNIFRLIGLVFLGIGLAGSVVYCFVVKTQLPRIDALLILFMAVLPSAFNFFYSTKYRILLQAEQKEYIISLAGISTVTIGYLVNIIVVLLRAPMLTVRFVTMISTFFQCIVIAWYCKRSYKYIDFSLQPDYQATKGTKDIFIQKITSVIYSTVPIVFISSVSSAGTKLASVYAVYNSVFALIKTFLHAVMDAPRLSFGQLIAEEKREIVFQRFLQYEFVVVFSLTAVLSTASALIMPFVRIYTFGITDINYIDPIIAILMIAITATEIIHIPSGNIINMSGNFKTGKRIQLIACPVLIISLLLGMLFFGVYGILSAVLLTAIVLAVLEIGFVHKFYFSSIKPFFLQLLPNIALFAVLVILETSLLPTIHNYLAFAIWGAILFAFNCGVTLIFNYYFHRANTQYILKMIIRVLKNAKH